jgi:PAS domain S-box-containing protein
MSSPNGSEAGWPRANAANAANAASAADDPSAHPIGVLRREPGLHAAGERPEVYRLLVDSVRDYAIFVLDPEGVIRTWNAGAERLKGYTAEESVGRHFSMFYPPDDIAAGKPQQMLEAAARDGRVEDEGWRVRRDGTLFWADVIITALRDPAGTLVGFAKVTRDLTERLRAEETLRQSEERFRLIIQGVRDYAIFMLDPDGRIASWNVGAQRIKGYTPGEIIGRHFSVFYPSEEAVAGKPQWELRVAARDGTYEEEGWRVRKDGASFWASVVITALRNDEGELVGYAKVTRDLTERRAAQERALADARRIAEAEAASRTKSEFLAAMSHELRTPINATLGYTELLELGIGGMVSEQQRGYLARIRGSQEHLLRIITDLLDYSRIEAGKVRYDIASVPASEMIDAVLPMVAPQAMTKEVALERGPCPDGLVARADRTRAQQIVLNLLSNAVKFTPSGGQVRISCEGTTGSILITVADTGPGIPQDHQAAIFEPFVQIGRSLTSGREGTGLGLAISRDLARAMGGDVTVESTPGQGSRFTLSLRQAEEG